MEKTVDAMSEIQFTEVNRVTAPQFLNKDEMPSQALTDPDYRLKLLQAQYGNMHTISCSKCHHCR